MLLRILASFALLLSILFMPFWVSIILVLISMAYFSFFWEVAPLLLLSDLLYGVKEARFFGMIFIPFITSIILLAVVEIFKKKLRFYP